MKRVSSHKRTPTKEEPPKTNDTTTKKPAQLANVQYLDENGNTVGAPLKMQPVGSDLAQKSDAHSHPKDQLKRKQSNTRPPQGTPAADSARQNESTSGDNIRPAVFYQQFLHKRKGWCAKCAPGAVINHGPATEIRMLNTRRSSIAKLVNQQRMCIVPSPECEHDEIILADRGHGFAGLKKCLPGRTTCGQLIWVGEPAICGWIQPRGW